MLPGQVGVQDGQSLAGLEEQVCSAAPFDAAAIVASHAQLAALIAGFGLAGFILLLDRGHERLQDEQRRAHANGALLFALAAIVGLAAAYLFSSASGDHCLNAQVEFDHPAALLVIAGLLLVSGITVAAASHPELSDTATALRLVLVLTAIVACGWLAHDYEYSDQIARRYDHFVSEVTRLEALSPSSSRPRIPTGRTSTLDQQLGRYAQDRWYGREAEWPGLLADDLFDKQPPPAIARTLVLTSIAGLLLAAYVARRMQPINKLDREAARQAISENATDEAGDSRDTIESRTSNAEQGWRLAVTLTTVLATVAVIVLSGFTVGTGAVLIRPSSLQRVTVFAAVVVVLALLVQPPLVSRQRSVAKALSVSTSAAVRPLRSAFRKGHATKARSGAE